jgi:hypothetical protein
MMRWKNRLFLLSLAALGCSGRYEVGEMDPGGGGSNTAGSNTSGSNTAGSNTAGQGAPGSGGFGNASAGGAAATGCFTAVAPTPLAGPFAPAMDVEARLFPFIFGDETWSLGTPDWPGETTYARAGQYVDEAFAMVIAETGGIPGGDYFVKQWLGIDTTEVLQGNYGSAFATNSLLLETLLQTDLGQGRTGAFSEKPWLEARPSIPLRGLDMAQNVFGVSIPTPPADIDRSVDPTLQDREALEAKITNPSCVGCHQLFSPLGYALGHFDAAGDYRSLDHDRPIDTSGYYPLGGGATLEFDGIADFGAKAVATCEANLGVVDSFLHIALTARGFDSEARYPLVEQHRERVQQAFIARGRTYQALVRAYAQSPLVLY